MKNGAATLKENDGMISANNTIALGVDGPTRSIAADKIITYKILFNNPNMKNEANVRCVSEIINIARQLVFDYLRKCIFCFDHLIDKIVNKKIYSVITNDHHILNLIFFLVFLITLE